jgi:hypothetical protein
MAATALTSRGFASLAVAAAVAVAFADSSIVVLALPELYTDLDTSIVGVSWVITGFNVAVALGVFALLPFLTRVHLQALGFVGVAVFLAASVGCGFADGLTALVVGRCAQGAAAAVLLAGSLPILVGLAGDRRRAVVFWAGAATVGLAVGPALGGVLTEAFSWRAIFFAQAPVAGLALLAAFVPASWTLRREVEGVDARPARTANFALLCLFAALVGALFLAVLLVVTVWDYGPLAGAGIVTALPAGALAARPLARLLTGVLDALGGAALLAAGLMALALLPASSPVYAVPALALCGVGLGLAVPALTHESVPVGPGLDRSALVSLGARHLGLVLGLLAIAPLLAYELDRGGERATINATAIILDAPLPLTKKVPIALALRNEFEQTPNGEIPDLAGPFEQEGAGDDPEVAETHDSLFGAIEGALTRSFRSSFALAAAFAVAAGLFVLPLRRRLF